jgi:hypothetical protein
MRPPPPAAPIIPDETAEVAEARLVGLGSASADQEILPV